MQDLAASNDAPSPDFLSSTGDINVDDDSSAKVSDPSDTRILNSAQDVLDRPIPEESNENTHSKSNDSNTDPNIFRLDEVSLPKVKAARVIDSSVTADSPQSPNVESPYKLTQIDRSRVVVDTAAPIESVKDAVSKFGGIVDWKTHKLHTLERCRFIDQELDKTQEEMVEWRKRTQVGENSVAEISAELERIRKQVNELELQLSSLSLQQRPIADCSNAAADTEFIAIVAEHEAALAELKYLKEELDAQKTVIELTAELVTEKQSLAAAQAGYKKAEDQKSALIVTSERDNLSWEIKMKQIEAEVDQYLSAKNLKAQLDLASALLCSLKAELESKIQQETELVSMQKELEMVKLGINKAAAEVSFLKADVVSLQSELVHEKYQLTALEERKCITMAAVQSLETELSIMKSEIALVETKKKEAVEKLEDLPTKLQQTVDEADHVKLSKQAVEEELRLAMEEAKEANAELITSTTKLHSATKEKIQATIASDELAFAVAAINSQQETETILTTYDIKSADAKSITPNALASALIELDTVKKSEFQRLEKLEQVSQELALKKETYTTAVKKCDTALTDKLKLEQEMRSWRTKNEQRRKANATSFVATESAELHQVLSSRSIKLRKDARKSGKVVATEPFLHHTPSTKSGDAADQSDSSPDLMLARRKKRSLFPRLLMFFGKRKPHASKKLL